jgi:small subunit ribosomal protein S8
MVMTDPIADLLTRVRNALRSRHPRTEMPSSKVRVEIARILKEEGYIADFKVSEKPGGKRLLALTLRYGPEGDPVLSGLERVSRPGCRVYAPKDGIPSVLGGIGMAVVSTSKGIMTGDEARRRKLGGEVLCKVW